jgi:saccharopine dehydrogenase (NADP+, L-glutamate forming)
MKKVLILGAGLVAGPIIKYLLDKGYLVTVASNNPDRAKKLIDNSTKGNCIDWNANDLQTLDNLIATHDITVSLLPFSFHVMVAEKCIAHKKNMVTTSYVKPEMQKLDKKAKEAEIIILNECGLDPGIDHMSAKSIIDTIHGLSGKIIEFYSICGALPAPEISHCNPFRYKFSWRPKGVILASNNGAKYLKNGKEILIKPEDLFKETFMTDISKVEQLEVYPNRNSIPYINIYNIPEVKTMYRGTFRYKGWCETLDAMKTIKLTNEKVYNFSHMTYADMMAKMIGISTKKDLLERTAKKLNLEMDSDAIKAFEFLGLFNDEPMNRENDSTFVIGSDLFIE